MSLIVSLIIVAIVRMGLTVLLGIFNVNVLYIDLSVDFVLALIFALFNYTYSSRKNAWKDIMFHRTFALAFTALVAFTVLSTLYNLV